jgi:DNA-binding transcriptional ArsR family regulator
MHSRAMVDSEPRVRRLMSCLGDPSRFELVRRLLRGDRCVSDLAQDIGLSQSCTTRHLQVLQREQMVLSERNGKRVMFRLCLDEPQVSALLSWAMSARASARSANPARSVPKRRSAAPRGEGRDVPSRAPANASRAAQTPGPVPETTSSQASDPVPPPRRAARSDLEDYLL